MDTMIEFLMNSNGAYDLGSMIKMSTLITNSKRTG